MTYIQRSGEGNLGDSRSEALVEVSVAHVWGELFVWEVSMCRGSYMRKYMVLLLIIYNKAEH